MAHALLGYGGGTLRNPRVFKYVQGEAAARMVDGGFPMLRMPREGLDGAAKDAVPRGEEPSPPSRIPPALSSQKDEAGEDGA